MWSVKPLSSGALAAAGSGSGAGAGASLAMVSLLVAVLLLMGFRRRSNRYDSCRKCKCVKVKVHPPSLDRSTEVVEGWDIGGERRALCSRVASA